MGRRQRDDRSGDGRNSRAYDTALDHAERPRERSAGAEQGSTEMRLVLIALATLWGIGAVLAFLQTREKTLDAKLTAAYFVGWPALLVLVYLNQPLPLWIGVPVMFGFVPWFLSGPHLWGILQDPSRSKSGEVVGIPIGYWKWGSIGAVLIGIIFNVLVRP